MQYTCFSTLLMLLSIKLTHGKPKRLHVHSEFLDEIVTFSGFVNTDLRHRVDNVNNRIDCLLLCMHHHTCRNANYIMDLKLCLMGKHIYTGGRTYIKTNEAFSSIFHEVPATAVHFPLTIQHGKPPPFCGLNAFGYQQDQDYFWPNRVRRIVGGWNARPYDVPFIGVLTRNSRPLCSAILVSKNPTDKSTSWGLVAAHCIFNNPYKPRGSVSDEDDDTDDLSKEDLIGLGFLFGLYDSKFQTPHIIYREAARVFLHPDNSVKSRDVALVRFSKPVKYNSYINGLCLPDLDEEINLHATAQCYTCGWGATIVQKPPRQASDTLKCIEMDAPGNTPGMNTHSLLKMRSSGHSASKGPYHGDSGSPLFCRIPETPNRIFLYGLVTGGTGFSMGTYAAAARIPYYMPWINPILHRRPSNEDNQHGEACCSKFSGALS